VYVYGLLAKVCTSIRSLSARASVIALHFLSFYQIKTFSRADPDIANRKRISKL